MNTELTVPGITQTIIITRAELRTPVPDRESISELGRHGATIAFYLSIHLISEVVNELLKGGTYNLRPLLSCIQGYLERSKNNKR